MRTGVYYVLDSNGVDTNLQIYSLVLAGQEWHALRVDSLLRDAIPYFHERCCSVIALCGTSVFQLAGQNDPAPTKCPDSPRQIIERLAAKHPAIAELHERLGRLLNFYDAVRHFGLSTSGEGHARVTKIGFAEAQDVVATTRAFWKTMIATFGRDPEETRLLKIDVILPT